MSVPANTPTSQRERTKRENDHLKFYELPPKEVSECLPGIDPLWDLQVEKR